MLTRLLHTRFRVNDLERTVDFYERVLGLKVVRRLVSPRGAKLAFIGTPTGEEIEICQLQNAPTVVVQPDLVHLGFEVDDLTAVAAELEKRGCRLSDGPTPTDTGAIIAFVDAPEGYEIELIQFLT